MLHDFLLKNQEKILSLTELKTRELAGDHPSSNQLKQGLPIFYSQVIEIIRSAGEPSDPPTKDVKAIANAADRGDEPGMAEAAGQPAEAELAKTAGRHGTELVRLGYSLSHVVHAYGALCQSITEVASNSNYAVAAKEFNALNRCLDVAIAGAVTVFQAIQDSKAQSHEDLESGFLSHEMRSALASANVAFQSIRNGNVGFKGDTGKVLENSLKRMGDLIDQSLSQAGVAVKNLKNSSATPNVDN